MKHRVDLYAIDAASSRWCADASLTTLELASTAASSPRNDFAKNYRVHPTHWLIYTQADYLANSAAISLTVVFIIGSMMDSESCSRGFQAMTLFAYWTFLSMILMVPAFYFSRSWQKIAIAVMWTSMLIPLRNTIIYNLVLGKIRSNWIHKRDLSMTFLGRPGSKSDWKRKQEGLGATAGKDANKKGSQNALDPALRTFVVKGPGGDDKKPNIILNPDILSREAQATTYAEAGSAKRGRFEPWQFDAKNQYIYCGLHRNYFQDKEVRKVIDKNEHNMPYQRRLRHEPPVE